MSQANRPATLKQSMSIFRMTGYDTRGTLLTVARAADIIGRLTAGESKSEIIRELESLGALKRFEVKDDKDTGLGFQVIFDKCVVDAEKANSGLKKRRPAKIILKAATKKFSRWVLQKNLGVKVPRKSGVFIDAPSVEYAKRFNEILNYYGIEASISEEQDED